MFKVTRNHVLQIICLLFIANLFFLNCNDCLAQKDVKKGKPAATYVDPAIGMEFVYVQGGCFQMGDTFGDGGIEELPVHETCLDDFYIGKYEVTIEQFRKFVLQTGYKTVAEIIGQGYGISAEGLDDRALHDGLNWKHPLWPSDSIAKKMDHPVTQISWDDAVRFLRWMNKKTGENFRLPTEAEWEFAARNRGEKVKYSWGNGKPSANIADDSLMKCRKYKYWHLWEGYKDGYIYTAPVGKFKPNKLGIYDITGNVSEWCHDWYDEEYYKVCRKNNPIGPEFGFGRSVRGGSWNFKPYFLRCSSRVSVLHNNWTYYLGFRVVKTID